LRIARSLRTNRVSRFADNLVSYPGCNRVWPLGSAPSLLRSTRHAEVVNLAVLLSHRAAQ